MKSKVKTLVMCLFLLAFAGMASDLMAKANAASGSAPEHTGYIPSQTTNKVDVVDLSTGTVEIGKISVGSQPYSASIHPNGTQVLVTNSGDGTVSVIDPATNTVTNTVTVGSTPYSSAYNQDGSKAYVANYGGKSISVIDTASLTVTDTISLNGKVPMSLLTIGTRLYVTIQSGKLKVFDLTDNSEVTELTIGSMPYNVTANRAGSKIYTANFADTTVSVIDVASLSVDTIELNATPGALEVTPDGSKLYVTIPKGVSKDKVFVVDTSNKTKIGSIPVGSQPYGMGISSDGAQGYVVNYGSDNMSIVDLSTDTVSSTITLGDAPYMVGPFMIPTARAAATKAKAENNSFTASAATVAVGAPVVYTAVGDRQSAAGAVVGDERYVPALWTRGKGASGPFSLDNGAYTYTYSPAEEGSFEARVLFDLEKWNGTAWVTEQSLADTKSVTVDVTSQTQDAYAIAPLADQTAAALTEGYAAGAQETLSIFVVNTGTAALTNVSAALGGTNADSFVLTPPAASLNAGASDTMTVRAKDDLAAGTYNAAVTVSADNLTSATFAVTQIVNTAGGMASPQNLKADGGDRQIALSWNNVTGAVYYHVYMSTATGQYDGVPIATVTNSTYVVPGLSNGKAYYFTVKAEGMAGLSAASNEAAGTPAIVPLAPTNVTAIAGDGLAVVSFASPDDDGGSAITGYEVTASPGMLTAAGTRSPITVAGLSNGVSYTFTVKAINGAGTGAASEPSNSVVPSAAEQTNDSGSDSPSPSLASSAPSGPSAPSPASGAALLVNGKAEQAGTTTASTRNDQSVLTIAVDQKKLEERLLSEGPGAVVAVTSSGASDIFVSELNGRMVKSLEEKTAVLEIHTDRAVYTLPAQQINIDAISEQIGRSVSLQDIKILIEVAVSSADKLKTIESAANQNRLELLAAPIDFTVKGVYGDTTVEISKFNTYVERAVAIPDPIEPGRITTAVVVEADGTIRHVPTKVKATGGRYFAVVNSLTNSTYLVVSHSVAFSDITNHWAQDAVNDMGARLVLEGTGEGAFHPDQSITRAEFAAIFIRALGLKSEKGGAPFADVSAGQWYADAVNTAFAHRLIGGFEDGTFRPDDWITREQAMSIIASAMPMTGLKAKLKSAWQSEGDALRPYADAAQSSAWARSAIVDSLQSGVVTGRDAFMLAPKEHVSRAEVAVMIRRFLQKSELI